MSLESSSGLAEVVRLELCHFGWSNSKNLPRGATVPGFSTAFPRVSALVCCDAGGTDASARAETRAPHLEAGREHMRSRTWGDEESEGSPSLVLTNSKVNGKRGGIFFLSLSPFA